MIKSIKKALETTEEHGKLIYLSFSGSRLHGTENENSDLDIKGIYMPNLKTLLKKDTPVLTWASNKDQKNTSSDIDIDILPLGKFLHNLSAGEMTSVDLYFSMFNPSNILFEEKEYTDKLRQNKSKLISNNYDSFFGFAYSQLERYRNASKRYLAIKQLLDALPDSDTPISDIDLPKIKGVSRNDKYLKVLHKKYLLSLKSSDMKELLKKRFDLYGDRVKSTAMEGESFKALSHSLRALLEAKEIKETGHLSFPLKNAELLRDIKEGKIERKKVEKLIEDLNKDKPQATKKNIDYSDLLEELSLKYILELYTK